MADETKNSANLPAEKKQAKPAKAKPSGKPSVFARIHKWFRELRSEAKKVMWPSRKQVTNNTAVVIVTVLIIGAFVWTIDFLLQLGVTALLQRL